MPEGARWYCAPRMHDGEVALDGGLEPVLLVSRGNDGVQEAAQRPLHDRRHEILSIAEMDVEGPPGKAGVGADRVQTRTVESPGGELLEGGLKQRLAGLPLALFANRHPHFGSSTPAGRAP